VKGYKCVGVGMLIIIITIYIIPPFKTKLNCIFHIDNIHIKMKAINNEPDIEEGVNKAGVTINIDVDEKGKFEGWPAITACCFCLFIAIVCVCVSLQYNEPQDNEIIRIEGPPLLAFGLGAMILGCIIFCITAAACVRCCDVCLVFLH